MNHHSLNPGLGGANFGYMTCMSISAIGPVGGAAIAPAPSTAAQSTYLIDTYGAPFVGAAQAAIPVYAQPALPLVSAPAPVAGATGALIDTYA